MDTITPVDLKIRSRLENPDFRHQFFMSMSRHETATQIRDLRLKRGKRQIDVAHEGGMGESAISRIEKSDYSGWTFKTLWKVAKALNARVRIVFEPMEDALREFDKIDNPFSEPTTTFGASLTAYLRDSQNIAYLEQKRQVDSYATMSLRRNIQTNSISSLLMTDRQGIQSQEIQRNMV